MREPLAVRDPRRRVMRIWLWSLAALIFAMVLVGGATRLTESGLSITEWQPVTGTLPPMSEAAWTAAFDKYKAIPQYQQVNRGMSLAEFKTIFWWEWAHRLLGRLIGAAFLLPFLGFLWRGWVGPGLRGRLVDGGVRAHRARRGVAISAGLPSRPGVPDLCGGSLDGGTARRGRARCREHAAARNCGRARRAGAGADLSRRTGRRIARRARLQYLADDRRRAGARGRPSLLRAAAVAEFLRERPHGAVPAPHDGLRGLARRAVALARRPAVAPQGPAHRRASARGRGDAAGGARDPDADPSGADRSRARPSGDGDDRAGARHSARGAPWRGRAAWRIGARARSLDYAAPNPCSRSAMMSSLSSSPIDNRTTSGPAPACTFWASDSWRWVVEAGWMISERVSPILARCENSFTFDTSLTPAS